ncbi:MAG: hypothetical protein P1U86_09220 [Verrucomicrobiales bacterium]|nr:hypothetical protein [Verrucomicrobiales bacterium]
MQSNPFKFRHVNPIVGAFLFFTAATLIVVAVLAGKSQEWFAEVSLYRVELPAALPSDDGTVSDGGTMGIKAGSDVRVIGNQVGNVKRVELCLGEDLKPIDSFENIDLKEIRLAAVLSVKGDFGRFIGADSKAVLKYDLGGLGSAYFDISRGIVPFPEGLYDKDAPRILDFDSEKDTKEEVFETVKRIEDEILPAIQTYRKTAETMTAFIEKLSDDNEALYRSLNSLEEGIGELNAFVKLASSGDGALGDMISPDSQMRKEFNEFAVTLNSGTENLKAAIDNLDVGITELRSEGINSINRAAEKLPTTVAETNETIVGVQVATANLNEAIREMEILVIGLQKHWLVKRYIEDPIEDPREEAEEKRKSTPLFNRKPREETKQEESSSEKKKPGFFKLFKRTPP